MLDEPISKDLAIVELGNIFVTIFFIFFHFFQLNDFFMSFYIYTEALSLVLPRKRTSLLEGSPEKQKLTQNLE